MKSFMKLKESLLSPDLLYIRAVLISGDIWGYRIIHRDSTSPSGKALVSSGTKEEVETLVSELGLSSFYVSPTEYK